MPINFSGILKLMGELFTLHGGLHLLLNSTNRGHATSSLKANPWINATAALNVAPCPSWPKLLPAWRRGRLWRG